jgi:hypothetical protein
MASTFLRSCGVPPPLRDKLAEACGYDRGCEAILWP